MKKPNREHLARFIGKRLRVRATVAEHSLLITDDNVLPTTLLKDIWDHSGNRYLATHIWLMENGRMKKQSLKPGDVIEFNCFVNIYEKSNGNKSIGMDSPSAITILKRAI